MWCIGIHGAIITALNSHTVVLSTLWCTQNIYYLMSVVLFFLSLVMFKVTDNYHVYVLWLTIEIANKLDRNTENMNVWLTNMVTVVLCLSSLQYFTYSSIFISSVSVDIIMYQCHDIRGNTDRYQSFAILNEMRCAKMKNIQTPVSITKIPNYSVL